MTNPNTDMSTTTAPKSDQMNYDDFIAGPMNITIRKVTIAEGGDQPASVFYEGDNNKPFKPCKSMRRVMVAVWGKESTEYSGKSMTLYGDANVKWAGKAVGGIRISHMSHIDKIHNISITTTKGQRKPHTVKPLKIEMVDPDPEIEEYADLYDRACQQAENGMSFYKDFFGALSAADKKRLNDSGDHDKLKVLADAVEKEPEY